ncbi:MAG: CRP-like cAMP-binding protein, partial [Glaciecola sp.]
MTAPMFDFGDVAEQRAMATGDVLCEEGGTDTDVFLVVTGGLDVERATPEGPMVVASMGPGKLVGEVTNAMGGARTATLRANAPSVISVLTQDQFISWLDAKPDAAEAIAAEARLRLNRSRAASVLATLFGLDNHALVDAIVSQIQWVTLSPGDLLFERGDEADAAYLLIAGRLHLSACDADGLATLDLEIGRGQIVGEMGIIQDAPRNASARAIRETTLAMITREALEFVATAYPAVLMRVVIAIIDKLTHNEPPDERARVVGFAVTAPNQRHDLLDDVVAAVAPFGSTLHLSATNLGHYVRDLNGSGASGRVAEFLHEADVSHDYVVLEGDADLTPWSISVAKQSDRFILLCSANPDREERQRIKGHLDLLTDGQRAVAWLGRLHPQGVARPRETPRFLDDHKVGEVHNLRAHEPRDLRR